MTQSPAKRERSTYDRALDMLEARARGVEELRRRLLKKGEPEPDVDAAIERLRANGLLDDANFARQLTRSKALGAGLSRRRIAQELAKRGSRARSRPRRSRKYSRTRTSMKMRPLNESPARRCERCRRSTPRRASGGSSPFWPAAGTMPTPSSGSHGRRARARGVTSSLRRVVTDQQSTSGVSRWATRRTVSSPWGSGFVGSPSRHILRGCLPLRSAPVFCSISRAMPTRFARAPHSCPATTQRCCSRTPAWCSSRKSSSAWKRPVEGNWRASDVPAVRTRGRQA